MKFRISYQKYFTRLIEKSVMAAIFLLLILSGARADPRFDATSDEQLLYLKYTIPASQTPTFQVGTGGLGVSSETAPPAARRYVALAHHLAARSTVSKPLAKGRTSATRAGPFGSVLIPFSNVRNARQWQPISVEIATRALEKCLPFEDCSARAKKLAGLISMARNQSFSARLRTVNVAVNRLIRYESDFSGYKAIDHWAGPSETLARGRGDCEDFAILKMAALSAAGVPIKSMSLVVLFDRERRLFHAVLLVSTDQGRFVLDNLRQAVLKDTDLPYYQPLFSLSEGRTWIHGIAQGQRLAGLSQPIDLASAAPGTGDGGTFGNRVLMGRGALR